jgi:hypothetical protein
MKGGREKGREGRKREKEREGGKEEREGEREEGKDRKEDNRTPNHHVKDVSVRIAYTNSSYPSILNSNVISEKLFPILFSQLHHIHSTSLERISKLRVIILLIPCHKKTAVHKKDV